MVLVILIDSIKRLTLHKLYGALTEKEDAKLWLFSIFLPSLGHKDVSQHTKPTHDFQFIIHNFIIVVSRVYIELRNTQQRQSIFVLHFATLNSS